MTTKAEELARHLAEAMAIPKEVAIIQQHIEQYGRLVQEAAAKEAETCRVYLIADDTFMDGKKEIGNAIREMPLP